MMGILRRIMKFIFLTNNNQSRENFNGLFEIYGLSFVLIQDFDKSKLALLRNSIQCGNREVARVTLNNSNNNSKNAQGGRKNFNNKNLNKK